MKLIRTLLPLLFVIRHVRIDISLNSRVHFEIHTEVKDPKSLKPVDARGQFACPLVHGIHIIDIHTIDMRVVLVVGAFTAVAVLPAVAVFLAVAVFPAVTVIRVLSYYYTN